MTWDTSAVTLRSLKLDAPVGYRLLHGCPHSFRFVGGCGDADLLRVGRSQPTFILAFAASCVLGSANGFLQGAWPFGLLEAIWSLVAVRRWLRRRAAPV